MPRVLVVDDDPEVVSLIGKLLQAAGHTAVPASDSRAALRILDETPIDLVIADIFMPDMDGLETVAAFKRQAPHLPLIALSGFAFAERGAGAPDFLAMATKLGAACSLRKPFEPEELMAAVEECLPVASAGLAPLRTHAG